MVVLIFAFSAMCVVGIIPGVQDVASGDKGSWHRIPNIYLSWVTIIFSLIGVAFGVSAGRNIAYANHDRSILSSKHRTGGPSLLQKGLRFFIGLPLVFLGVCLLVQAVFKEVLLDAVSLAIKGGLGSWTAYIIVGTVGGILITIPWEWFFRERVDRFHPTDCVTKWGKRLDYAQSLAHSVADLPFKAVRKATDTTRAVASASVQMAGRVSGDMTRIASQVTSKLPFPAKVRPAQQNPPAPTVPASQATESPPAPPPQPRNQGGAPEAVHSAADLPLKTLHKANETARLAVSASADAAGRVTGNLKQVASQLPLPFRSGSPVGGTEGPTPPPPPEAFPSNSLSAAARYCPSCGVGNGREYRFCQGCGKTLPP